MQNHSDVQIIATNKPTIVLVHGAFADGSTWNQVIQLLQVEGFNTIAVQNPLSSLDDDVLEPNVCLIELKVQLFLSVILGEAWSSQKQDNTNR